MHILIRHIEYLISRNDCVIIPDFGALLAHYEKAEYDAEAETYAPPRRQYAFNGALSHTDGVLAHSVSRAEGVSYDIAASMVTDGVTELKSRLREYKLLPLGRVGTMSYDEDTDTTSFAPFAYDCLSVATAYLPTVAAPRRAKVPRPIPYQEPEQPVVAVHHRSHWSRAVRIAASLLLLIGICFVASTPLPVDDAALASLTPEIRQTTIEEIVPSAPAPVVAEPQPAPQPEPVVETVEEPAPSFDDMHYLLIVGSFIRQADADLYIQQLGDDELQVYVADGKYRIYTSAHATQKEAYAQVAKTQARYPNVWVCKK